MFPCEKRLQHYCCKFYTIMSFELFKLLKLLKSFCIKNVRIRPSIQKNKGHLLYVIGHMSPVMFHMSHIICKLSPKHLPDLQTFPLLSRPICTVGWFAKTGLKNPKVFKPKKIMKTFKKTTREPRLAHPLCPIKKYILK